MAMASGTARIVEGTLTFDTNQNSIAINVPFQPKMFLLNLRAMQSSDTTYKTFFEIGAFFTNTENVTKTFPTENGMVYECDGTYGGASRGTFLVLPTYSNGVLTLSPRSGSQNFAKGIYDFIIVG